MVNIVWGEILECLFVLLLLDQTELLFLIIWRKYVHMLQFNVCQGPYSERATIKQGVQADIYLSIIIFH